MLVFQIEILGKDIKDEHPANIELILVILLVSHFDISGNDFSDEHPAKIFAIL